jgi:hypothetical protein
MPSLHYFDLGPQYRNSYKFAKAAVAGTLKSSLLEDLKPEQDITKDGKLAEVLSASQTILVQIAKEPDQHKRPAPNGGSDPGRALYGVGSIHQQGEHKQPPDR